MPQPSVRALGLAAVAVALAALAVWRGRVARYSAVVRQIEAGVLPVPASGPVELPAALAHLTPHGQITVATRSDGGRCLLFPTGYGRGQDLAGYLYTSRPLRPADYYTLDGGPGGIHRHLDIGGRDRLTVRPFRPHWYRVQRRLD